MALRDRLPDGRRYGSDLSRAMFDKIEDAFITEWEGQGQSSVMIRPQLRQLPPLGCLEIITPLHPLALRRIEELLFRALQRSNLHFVNLPQAGLPLRVIARTPRLDWRFDYEICMQYWFAVPDVLAYPYSLLRSS